MPANRTMEGLLPEANLLARPIKPLYSTKQYLDYRYTQRTHPLLGTRSDRDLGTPTYSRNGNVSLFATRKKDISKPTRNETDTKARATLALCGLVESLLIDVDEPILASARVAR